MNTFGLEISDKSNFTTNEDEEKKINIYADEYRKIIYNDIVNKFDETDVVLNDSKIDKIIDDFIDKFISKLVQMVEEIIDDYGQKIERDTGLRNHNEINRDADNYQLYINNQFVETFGNDYQYYQHEDEIDEIIKDFKDNLMDKFREKANSCCMCGIFTILELGRCGRCI